MLKHFIEIILHPWRFTLENIHYSASRALFKKALFCTKIINIIKIADISVFELWMLKSSKQALGAVRTESLTKILFSLRVLMAKVVVWIVLILI